MHNILTTAWLEDLAQQPSSTAYRLLSPHYMEAYTNERFVFYNAQPVDTRHFEHLLKVLDYIDISRSFCLVITNQQETFDYFKTAGCSVEFQDSIPISPGVKDPVDPLYYNKNLCVHAWTGLHLHPSGETRICCEYQGNIPNSNIQQNDFNDILASEFMDDIRDQFRKGKTPSGCIKCKKRELAGLNSKRSMSPYKLSNIFGYVNWESNDISETPKFIGGHIGNLCNLKCRICTNEYSSQIASEEYKDGAPVLVTYNWNKGHETFWEFMRKNNQLVNFEILGGEPLLLPENRDFLEHLVNTKRAANCEFEFITNGTQYPEVLDHISEFKRFTITFSIDNTGKRFEYERKNAKWNSVTTNIKKILKQRSPNVKVAICLTVSALNVYYLPETISWAKSLNLDYYINIVQKPESIAVSALDTKTANIVSKKLSKVDELNEFVAYLSKMQFSKNCNDLISYIRNKDQLRNEDLSVSHPELAQLIGYSKT